MTITVHYKDFDIELDDKLVVKADGSSYVKIYSYGSFLYFSKEELDDFISRLTELKKLFKNDN